MTLHAAEAVAAHNHRFWFLACPLQERWHDMNWTQQQYNIMVFCNCKEGTRRVEGNIVYIGSWLFRLDWKIIPSHAHLFVSSSSTGSTVNCFFSWKGKKERRDLSIFLDSKLKWIVLFGFISTSSSHSFHDWLTIILTYSKKDSGLIPK